MSILDKASLVITPTAYREDKVYSIVPKDGSGDLTWTRATDATRINKDGYVERTPYNLTTYSEDFTNANWINNAYATPNAIASPIGNLTADKYKQRPAVDGSVYQSTFQTIFVKGGITTTRSIYVKAAEMSWVYLQQYDGVTNSGVYFNISNGTLGTINGANISNPFIQNVANGWYRIGFSSLSVLAATSERVQLALVLSDGGIPIYTGDGTSGVYIWGAQLVEGSVPKDYFPTTDRLNVPTITYPTTGGTPSILIEPQRTNLLLYSEDFDNNTNWVKQFLNTTGSPSWINTINSPSGIINSDKIIPNTGSSFHRVYTTLNITSGSTYSFSVFAKAGERNVLQLALNTGFVVSYTNAPYANFNLTNGTLGNNGNGVSNVKIESYGNGWYRCCCSATAIFSGTGEPNICVANSLTEAPFGGNTGNDVDGLYIWGAQLEQASTVSSYIPTTTAAVTRNADECYATGISSIIPQPEGSIFIDCVVESFNGNPFVNILNSERNITCSFACNLKASNEITFDIFNGGVSIVTMLCSDISYVIGQRLKILINYKTSNSSMYINGVLKDLDVNAFTLSSTFDDIYINDKTTYFAYQGVNRYYKIAFLPFISDSAQSIQLTTL